VGVPIDSVGRAGGTEHAPAAVRERDLLARTGAEDRGDLDVRIRGDERDPQTGVIGIDGVLATTEALRAAVRDIAAAGDRPLVLGGCCTVVPARWPDCATPAAPSPWPTSTATSTSTTGGRRRPARPPTCR
jgi:arginase